MARKPHFAAKATATAVDRWRPKMEKQGRRQGYTLRVGVLSRAETCLENRGLQWGGDARNKFPSESRRRTWERVFRRRPCGLVTRGQDWMWQMCVHVLAHKADRGQHRLLQGCALLNTIQRTWARLGTVAHPRSEDTPQVVARVSQDKTCLHCFQVFQNI